MKDTVGFLLREAWQEKGRSECSHADLHKEYSFSGTATGCYICATCGHQTEVTRMAPSSNLANEPQQNAQAAARSHKDRPSESNERVEKKARYGERFRAKVPVIITVASLVCEGRILDLSGVGCLIESPVYVKTGDSLQLKLCQPSLISSFQVALAAVRWTHGCQFGVEFIKMTEKDQRQLNQIMSQHLPNRALKKEENTQQFSDSGGLNGHLDTPLARRRK